MIIGYITGQSLNIQAPVVVSDSINYLTAQFFFQTEDWKGLTKWAHFKQGEKVYDFALENDRIEKDAHLNLSEGEWEVYLHGNEFADVEVVKRITTEIVKLTVNKSGVLEGEPFAEQPASEVERLNAKLDRFLEIGVTGAVMSVNGKGGEVVLTAEDVGALPADTKIPTVPEKVSEFKNDAKYQNAEQVQEIAQYEAKKVEEKIPEVPQKVSAFVNDAEYQTDDNVAATVKAWANIIEKKIPTIPTNVSVFANDAKYQTETDVTNVKNALSAEIAKKQDPIEKYVSEVNGKTGNVTLKAKDVGALATDADVVSSAELQIGLDAKQDVLDRYAKTVNGISGDVVLSASDVKALPESTVIPIVPKNVSEFQNDADYATRTFVKEAVNGLNIAFVFDSVADLDTWLSISENVSMLNTGDVFWIRDTGVPDYWWDGESKTKQIMETTKVDLSTYALKTEIPVKTSELQDDVGFATNASVDTKLGGYQPKLSEYVKTVNGKSGEVNLTASDVGALPSSTKIPVVPTNVSEFTNDANYQTAAQVESTAKSVAQTEVAKVEAKIPTVPTNVSAFTNDAGYLTADDVPSQIFNVLADDNTGTINCTFDELIRAIDDRETLVAVGGYPITQGVGFKFDNSLNTTGVILTVIGNNYTRSITIENNGSFSWSEQVDLVPGNNASSDVFCVPLKVGASGFELDGVTLAEIDTAFDAGKTIFATFSLPVGSPYGEGDFVIPLILRSVAGAYRFSILFGDTSGYVQVDANGVVSMEMIPVENANNKVTSISDSSTDKHYPSAKAVYNAIEAAKNEMGGSASGIFYVPFTVGASGFELDGVTYADIQEAYDAGKRLVTKGYVPDVLGIGVSGNFELPLSYLTENGTFSFAMICGQKAGVAFIGPDGNIAVQVKTLVSFEDNVTSSISQSASDKEVPSAKAVYDAIEEAKSAGGSGGMSQTVVTSVHSGSKDSEIPTAKAVYDAVYDHTITYFNVMCDNDRWYLLDTSFEDIMYKISSSRSKFAYALVTIVSSANLDIPDMMDDAVYYVYPAYVGYNFYCFAFSYGARRFELKIYDDDSVTITEVTN